jgi:hypothetical protein
MAKFRSAGSLAWSTLLTSAHINEVGGIAVDAAGRVYVTGATDSSTFPTRHAWDATLNGVEDAFVIKFTR